MADKKQGNASHGSSSSQALVPLSDQPPGVLPAMLEGALVPFPGPVVPIILDTKARQQAILHARSNAGYFLLINRANIGEIHDRQVDLESGLEFVVGEIGDLGEEDDVGDEIEEKGEATNYVDVSFDDFEGEVKSQSPVDSKVKSLSCLSPVGILARVLKVFRLPDNRTSALVQLLRRAQPIKVVKSSPFPIVRVAYSAEVVRSEKEFQATFRQVQLTLESFFEAHPNVSDDVRVAAMAIETPGILADFVAQHLSRDFKERLAFLTELDLGCRMKLALEVAIRELDMLTVGNRISKEIKEKVEKHQRDFLLREQLKAIRVELGEERDPTALAVEELKTKLDAAGLPERVQQRVDEELRRLQLVPTESPEHNLVRSYLEWIASLPWSAVSEELRDIVEARRILDTDHYGLDEVKDRILEFLAVHQLNPGNRGSILCLSGPPGVGKTSMGQSIARALGREFYRFSVGGMRDEAEIKGHRRTYVGAMPGRILQGLRQVKTANPVILLDELDKMGSDWRGDPSSAMLEVLDPAQNQNFLDHYLDLPFDLSRVMFIATANVKANIPGPLRDRLELIDLPGYIPEEKLEIARRHLLPKQRKDHGLTVKRIDMSKTVLRRVITEYTQEAGVRELNRLIAKSCRKRATEVVRGEKTRTALALDDLRRYLGPPKLHEDRLQRSNHPGVVMGLAWTAVGGTVLFIEAARMQGKGRVKVTGQLGDVMNESASIAVSYVRHQAAVLGVDPAVFEKEDLHLHFPAGAVPKDGPSAGITITTALVSLLTGKAVRRGLAMTGEISLGGEVLPVGGVREKVIAARGAGVKRVVLPARNRADVEEIPEGVCNKIEFVYASHIEEVLEAAFRAGSFAESKGEPKRRSSKKRDDGERGRRSRKKGPSSVAAKEALRAVDLKK